jgi:hypothetical protein
VRLPSRWRLGVLIAASALGSSCGSRMALDDASTLGVLSAHVVRFPVSPVGTPGSADSAPASGVSLRITRDGNDSMIVTTNSQGEIHQSLGEGSYLVELVDRSEHTKDLPRTLAIASGQETRIEVRLDSGLR